MSQTLSTAVRVLDGVKQLACPAVGTTYRALSSEYSTAAGLSPAFIIHDELGECRRPVSRLYEMLETATGAQADPLSVIISTQAATDADLLSLLIDDALAGHDPRTVLTLYATPTDLPDQFSDEALGLANPALGDFSSLDEARRKAAEAQRMPSSENSFRNKMLNQRVVELRIVRLAGDVGAVRVAA